MKRKQKEEDDKDWHDKENVKYWDDDWRKDDYYKDKFVSQDPNDKKLKFGGVKDRRIFQITSNKLFHSLEWWEKSDYSKEETLREHLSGRIERGMEVLEKSNFYAYQDYLKEEEKIKQQSFVYETRELVSRLKEIGRKYNIEDKVSQRILEINDKYQQKELDFFEVERTGLPSGASVSDQNIFVDLLAYQRELYTEQDLDVFGNEKSYYNQEYLEELYRSLINMENSIGKREEVIKDIEEFKRRFKNEMYFLVYEDFKIYCRKITDEYEKYLASVTAAIEDELLGINEELEEKLENSSREGLFESIKELVSE